MLHLIKQTLCYMKWNWLTLLLFELIHKFFALVVIIPTVFFNFNLNDATSRFNLFKS